MNAIEIRNLTKTYKDFGLYNISLDLPSGCIMGLIGENGAGKTTLIKSILDIAKTDSGTVKILGKDNKDNFSLTKNDIGVVLDEVGIPENFTAITINKVMKNLFINWSENTFFDYVKKFDLPEKKQFKKLSKGMKMKMGIAIALSHSAKLLILDEPTSGLDPLARDEIINILNEFTRQADHSVLISSHIVSDLEKICDYITFIHKGTIMLSDEKDRLLEQYGFLHTTSDRLFELDKTAIKGKRVYPYGVDALIDKTKIPKGFDTQPVTIEDLFVFMAKETV